MAEESPIRVLLVDDHGVVRRGIEAYLDLVDDIAMVGEAGNGHEALARVAEMETAGRPPDVVLMDLLMPEMDGIAATAAIKARWPDIEVVALTSFFPRHLLENMLTWLSAFTPSDVLQIIRAQIDLLTQSGHTRLMTFGTMTAASRPMMITTTMISISVKPRSPARPARLRLLTLYASVE